MTKIDYSQYHGSLLQNHGKSKRCLVQEPYRVRASIGSLRKQFLVLHEPAPLPVIIIRNDKIPSFYYKHLSTTRVACASIGTKQDKYVLVSVYCAITEELDKILNQLDVITRALPNKQIIIKGNLNAHSHLWGDPNNNNRADDILQFINSKGLHILNDPSSLPTFDALIKKSWVDITCCNNRALKEVSNWEVSEHVSLSDHAYLYFKLGTKDQIDEHIEKYDVRKVDWTSLKTNLIHKVQTIKLDHVKNRTDARDNINAFINIIQNLCDNHIPKKKKRNKAVP
ncbi:uncharacterized protein [Centruroides vittatus]|uniref:uncharacterized protein n=1 Tax=Centruroides vittatus TaxID=120091 RepID=UPI00350F61C5